MRSRSSRSNIGSHPFKLIKLKFVALTEFRGILPTGIAELDWSWRKIKEQRDKGKQERPKATLFPDSEDAILLTIFSLTYKR